MLPGYSPPPSLVAWLFCASVVHGAIEIDASTSVTLMVTVTLSSTEVSAVPDAFLPSDTLTVTL